MEMTHAEHSKESALKGKPKTGISENDRNAIVAVLAILALAAAAYVVLFSTPQDAPADGSGFYQMLTGSNSVGLFYDVRGADQAQASAIYQCGVDIIGKGRFAQKNLTVVSCNEKECVSISETLGFEQAQKKMENIPYVLIKPGESGYAFFQRHMEIYIGKNATGNSTCDIAAIES